MSEALKIADELRSVAEELEDERLITLSKFLKQRIAHPEAYVVALGETCSGKSALLNSVIDVGVLPVQGVPSTGAVVELYNDEDEQGIAYYVINKNATMEQLDQEMFDELALHPDENTERLRVVMEPRIQDLKGIRLFDTPGYGSLVQEHEEVLQDFLPNSDAVVYVVSYRVGIQQNDYEFLRQLKELSRADIPFYLVVNRTPQGADHDDRRVAEIYRSVKAFLPGREIPLFLVPNTPVTNGMLKAEQISDLRGTVVKELTSPQRLEELNRAYASYLFDMSDMLRSEVQRRLRSVEMEQDSKRIMQEETDKVVEEIRSAVPEVIVPGFAKLRKAMPRRVEQSADAIRDVVENAVERKSAGSKDQAIAFVKSHLVNVQTREQSLELEHYMRTELDDIERKVQDRVTTAVANFEAAIEVNFGSETVEAIQRAGSGILGRVLLGGLTQYFAAFGGAAGAGAGVANAASHALKVVGGWFNKTFSRETHNALKHMLAKIGLTSTKTLGALVGAAIEGIVVSVDYATWKPRLKKSVNKAIDQWAADTTRLIDDELNKLENENIKLIGELAEQYRDGLSVDDSLTDDPERLRDILKRLDDIDRRIAV